MLSLTLGAEEFAARRRKAQTDLESQLATVVREGISANRWGGVLQLVEGLFLREYRSESGETYPNRDRLNGWLNSIEKALDRGSYGSVHSVNSTALWLATAILTKATVEAAKDDPDDLFLEWVDMGDKAVRDAHRAVSGQVRPLGEPFDVGGVPMTGPGDVTAPVELWANCRCTLRPRLASEFTSVETVNLEALYLSLTPEEWAAAGKFKEMPMTTEAPEAPARELYDDALGVPWYGVWAVEDIWTGDKRRFRTGSLSHRSVPLPLTWQKVGDDGHKGHVTVAMAEHAMIEDGKFHAAGRFLMTVPESDEVIGLMAEFGRFGVSVDADSTTFELDEEAEGIDFTAARVSSACILPIPAFAEAWVTLGRAPWLDKKGEEEKPAEADVPEEDMLKPADEIPTDEDGAPVDPEKRKRVPAISRASLEENPADMLSVAMEAMRSRVTEFVDVAPGKTEDGPGWLTNPVDTDRIRDYWVSGPGAAKINWGVPGDFNRCRALVAEYVKPQHINGYCANRHYDALGFWPGRAPSEQGAETQPFAADVLNSGDEPGPAVSLVASVGHKAPAHWFANPGFARDDGRVIQVRGARDGRPPVYACPFTVTDEGQVYGHISARGMCHLNDELAQMGGCTEPPVSMTDYAYFLNSGVVRLDNGVDVPVGQITLGGGHAADGLSMRAAIAHYDSTSAAVCDVNAGDDEFGIWVAGWVRPGTSKEMVTALMASAISPDWRELNGNLEMIAALAVNVGGFAMTRPRTTVIDQRQVSLVASGVIAPSQESKEQVTEGLAEMGISIERLAVRIAAEMASIESNRKTMAALRTRVLGEES